MSEELKPCWRCGGDAEQFTWSEPCGLRREPDQNLDAIWVSVIQCGACQATGNEFDDELEVVAESLARDWWNHRAPSEQALKVVEELRELIANDPVGGGLPNAWLKKAINAIEARLKGEG